ncbi:MAG: NAD(P)H-binding protein [Archangiaceae bacterium]|nr:NAD(P)H-binding protein [Archangiaceae bacterium]
MRILIVGASRGTGALAVARALERGHEVTAFARNPDTLALQHPQLTRLKGDFHQAASLDAAVPSHDAVVLTASVARMAEFKTRPDYFSLGTGFAIEAMKRSGGKRLVVLSAAGVGDSLKTMNPLLGAVMVKWLLKLPYQDHTRQEQLVRDSGLDWVIAQPTRLTDGPARKQYVKEPGIKKVPSAISRADVADFLIEAVETPTWVRQTVLLGG